MSLEYACRVVPREGEAQCGDAVYARIDGDAALFALVDALGHGEGAAYVARRGIAALAGLPCGVDAVTALDALNAELHGTRGAAATICSFRGLEAQIVGVGNVACRGIGSRCSFVPTPGVVGFRRQLHSIMRLPISSGQRLLLHSDGVSSRFEPQLLCGLTPQSACDFMLRHHRHPHDDASVLVIGVKQSYGGLP